MNNNHLIPLLLIFFGSLIYPNSQDNLNQFLSEFSDQQILDFLNTPQNAVMHSIAYQTGATNNRSNLNNNLAISSSLQTFNITDSNNNIQKIDRTTTNIIPISDGVPLIDNFLQVSKITKTYISDNKNLSKKELDLHLEKVLNQNPVGPYHHNWDFNNFNKQGFYCGFREHQEHGRSFNEINSTEYLHPLREEAARTVRARSFFVKGLGFVDLYHEKSQGWVKKLIDTLSDKEFEESEPQLYNCPQGVARRQRKEIDTLNNKQILEKLKNDKDFKNYDGIKNRIKNIIDSGDTEFIQNFIENIDMDIRMLYLAQILQKIVELDLKGINYRVLDEVFCKDYNLCHSPVRHPQIYKKYFNSQYLKTLDEWHNQYTIIMSEIEKAPKTIKNGDKQSLIDMAYKFNDPWYNIRFPKQLKAEFINKLSDIRNEQLKSLLAAYKNHPNCKHMHEAIERYDQENKLLNKNLESNNSDYNKQIRNIDNIAQDTKSKELSQSGSSFLNNNQIPNKLNEINNIELRGKTRDFMEYCAQEHSTFMRECKDRAKDLRERVGLGISETAIKELQLKAIKKSTEEVETMIRVCKQMLSFAYGLGSEVCTKLWHKIKDSPLTLTTQTVCGIAICSVLPEIMLIGAAIIGTGFLIHSLYTKRVNLTNHFKSCVDALENDNFELSGREIIKGLHEGGELDLIYDLALFSIANRLTATINVGLKAQNIEGITKILNNIERLQAAIKMKGENLCQPFTGSVNNAAQFISQLTVETIADKMNILTKNFIEHLEKTTGEKISQEAIEEALVIVEDGIIALKQNNPKAAESVCNKMPSKVIQSENKSNNSSTTFNKSSKFNILEFETEAPKLDLLEFMPPAGQPVPPNLSDTCNNYGTTPPNYRALNSNVKRYFDSHDAQKKVIRFLLEKNKAFKQRAAKYNNTIKDLMLKSEHLYLLESAPNNKFKGLHITDIIELMPDKFKLVHKRDLGGGAYTAEVFYNGVSIGDKSFFPKINIMELLFESLESINWANTPIGTANKIIDIKMSVYGFKTEIIIDPKTKTISTFMPYDSNK